MLAKAADGVVFDSALRLRPPQRVGGHSDVAERIFFGAVVHRRADCIVGRWPFAVGRSPSPSANGQRSTANGMKDARDALEKPESHRLNVG